MKFQFLHVIIVLYKTSQTAAVSRDSQERMSEAAGQTSEVEHIQSDGLFPDTLQGFGYTFKDGKMVDLNTGDGFVFAVHPSDQEYNQRRYEALGEAVNHYVYSLLETEAKLKKVYLPTDAEVGEGRGFIFMSDDVLTNTDRLLVIIHGSGVVRAGQWFRRLIINDCLNSGTQLPYIERARNHGYAVIVLNTNQNYMINKNGSRTPIRGSANPTEHGLYVWDHFISKSPARFVGIVAHSYGGVVTLDMAVKKGDEFLSRVKSVAFTDSVHHLQYKTKSKNIISFFQKKCINWVSSSKPLGTQLEPFERDCPRVSAGTSTHELTSWTSIDEIFQFLTAAYTQLHPKQEF